LNIKVARATSVMAQRSRLIVIWSKNTNQKSVT